MASQDWPEAYRLINERGVSGTLLVCEHASRHMPAEYADLGLDAIERERHIAWDIGAEDVTRALSAQLDAPAFLGTYSRLLIDLNRPLGVSSSIPERSESTDIPGNVGLEAAERDRRRDRIFAPFHKRVSAYIDARRPERIVAIHSFTPVFHGVSRPWHVGILYGEAREFGEAVLARLSEDRSILAAAHVPYVVDRAEDYAVPIHGDDRGIPTILVEIRHDLIRDAKGAAEWARRLAAALD